MFHFSPPWDCYFFQPDREQYEKSMSKPTKSNLKSMMIYDDIYKKIFRKLGTVCSQDKAIDHG